MDAQSGGASGPGCPSFLPHGFVERELKTPARVNFAFDIVHWANDIEKGSLHRSYDGGAAALSEGRSLRECERAVYGAALEVMRLYLTGEMSFNGEEFDHSEDEVIENSQTCFFCNNAEEKS